MDQYEKLEGSRTATGFVILKYSYWPNETTLSSIRKNLFYLCLESIEPFPWSNYRRSIVFKVESKVTSYQGF